MWLSGLSGHLAGGLIPQRGSTIKSPWVRLSQVDTYPDMTLDVKTQNNEKANQRSNEFFSYWTAGIVHKCTMLMVVWIGKYGQYGQCCFLLTLSHLIFTIMDSHEVNVILLKQTSPQHQNTTHLQWHQHFHDTIITAYSIYSEIFEYLGIMVSNVGSRGLSDFQKETKCVFVLQLREWLWVFSKLWMLS